MATKLKIKDKAVYDYMSTLRSMAESDPDNASSYIDKMMGVYTGYLDSQNPQAKLTSLYGEDAAPAIARSGLNIDAITNDTYANYTKPAVAKFLELQNKSLSGAITDEEKKKMTALEKLIADPKTLQDYQTFVSNEGTRKSAKKGLKRWFKPQEQEAKNYVFKDYVGTDMGNINPLQ